MTPALAVSYDYCERLARREAANFYPAFRVLPGPQRRSMCSLYAFLRVSDDLSDGPSTLAEKHDHLSTSRPDFSPALTGVDTLPLHAPFHPLAPNHPPPPPLSPPPRH